MTFFSCDLGLGQPATLEPPVPTVGAMAPVNPPAWQQAGSYPARLDRLTIAGLLAPATAAGPVVARSGVRPAASGSALGVTQRTPADMFVTVNPGVVFIAATSALGGSYECINDGNHDVLVASANATLPRKDLLVARVYDAYDDIGARNEFALEMVKGVPAASPVLPAAPAGSVVLAQVTVPAAATSIVTANIADVRPYTTALGGTLPVINQAQRDALTPYAGMAVYRRDTGATETYTGSSWIGGGPMAYASDYASGGSFTTDATFIEFTSAQWPPIDIVCPASGALAVSMRTEAVNSSSDNSSFRFCATVKDVTAGGGTIIASSTLRGPCNIRGVANATGAVQCFDRFVVGGFGELTAAIGHTLRFVPAWYISTHSSGTRAFTNGRMTVEPLPQTFSLTT